MTQNDVKYRRLNIVGFTVDALQPLALFKDEAEETTFPLWLEMGDVLAITTDLLTNRLVAKGDRTDLLDSILGSIGLKVSSVLIDGNAASGYCADVCLEGDGGETRVRVELVTALLTAIRYKLPVGISDEALASSSLVDQSSMETVDLDDGKRLLEMLERMNPDDMGKYPM